MSRSSWNLAPAVVVSWSGGAATAAIFERLAASRADVWPFVDPIQGLDVPVTAGRAEAA